MATKLREPPLPNYQTDAVGWAIAQAAALHERRADLLDWENLAEEIRDVANRERDKLESALRLVLSHLLKWDHQSSRRSRSWHNTIAEQRRRVNRVLRDNPSLRPQVGECVAEAYQDGRGEAAVQMNVRTSSLPAECPYSFDELMTRPVEWDGEIA